MTLPHWAQVVLDTINNPMVKVGMVAIGTFILRRNPKVVDEVVPVWTGVYSIVTAVLGAIFPGHPLPGANAMLAPHTGYVLLVGTQVAAVTQPWWHSLIFDGILPWLIGFGGQRAAGQTGQWIAGTGGKPKDFAPEQLHPMDSISSKR